MGSPARRFRIASGLPQGVSSTVHTLGRHPCSASNRGSSAFLAGTKSDVGAQSLGSGLSLRHSLECTVLHVLQPRGV